MQLRLFLCALVMFTLLAAASCGDVIATRPGNDDTSSNMDAFVPEDLVQGSDQTPTPDIPVGPDVPGECLEPENRICEDQCVPCPTEGVVDRGCFEERCVALACEPGFVLHDDGCRAWQRSSPDQSGLVGDSIGIDIDSTGETHLVYHWMTASPPLPGVRWLHSRGVNWEQEEVGTGGTEYVSFALGPDDLPRIVFNPHDSTGSLYFRQRVANADEWEETGYPEMTVNPISIVSGSIAIDSHDISHVILRDEGTGTGRLLEAIRNFPHEDSSWSAVGIENNVSLLLPPYNESIDIDGYDQRHVAYYDGLLGELRYVVSADDGSIGWDTRTIAVGEAYSPDIAVGNDNQPRVAYIVKGEDAILFGVLENTWISDPIAVAKAERVALALGPDDEPHIAYVNVPENNRLEYAYLHHGEWRVSIVDPENPVGDFDIAVDAEGMPRIAYKDTSRNRVMLATW